MNSYVHGALQKKREKEKGKEKKVVDRKRDRKRDTNTQYMHNTTNSKQLLPQLHRNKTGCHMANKTKNCNVLETLENFGKTKKLKR